MTAKTSSGPRGHLDFFLANIRKNTVSVEAKPIITLKVMKVGEEAVYCAIMVSMHSSRHSLCKESQHQVLKGSLVGVV